MSFGDMGTGEGSGAGAELERRNAGEWGEGRLSGL